MEDFFQDTSNLHFQRKNCILEKGYFLSRFPKQKLKILGCVAHILLLHFIFEPNTIHQSFQTHKNRILVYIIRTKKENSPENYFTKVSSDFLHKWERSIAYCQYRQAKDLVQQKLTNYRAKKWSIVHLLMSPNDTESRDAIMMRRNKFHPRK